MAADFTQTNTVIDFTGSSGDFEIVSASFNFGYPSLTTIDFTGSSGDFEIIPFSLNFEVSNVIDFDSGGGGGSSRPASGFLYPRGTGRLD